MKGRYEAAFIVPVGVNKVLGEDGWECESPIRLSEAIKDYLIQSLRLSFLESYCGIESYVNDDLKMSITFNDQNEIEDIYFQLYGDALTLLSEVCQSGPIPAEAELFVPRHEHEQ
ncbi:hypothetical protein [Thiolinea disciformis]|uniref:hypothetical protein n=1 Tax=Thiolinea disciformis TaxID=125614 RepID=UPI0003700134|nr:hypothetical protein [Thiolinea disciformis]